MKKKPSFPPVFLFLFYVVPVLLVCSCKTVKNSTYFKTLIKDTTLQQFANNELESKIQKKDILNITVSSLNKDLDAQFNASSPLAPGIVPTNIALPGYSVDNKGDILVHYLGEVHAEGLTRKELKEKLQTDLLPYMKEPIVMVQYLNHKVTIMGDVASPQIINLPNEQMSLIDVIVSSGDMKEEANRADVLVIREVDGQKIVKHINLEDHSIFSSPWYYVQPNDIVYIQPNRAKINTEEKKRNLQATISLVVSGVSLLVIIINSLIR